MRKEHSAVFQLVYVASLHSENAHTQHLKKMHDYVKTQEHAALSGILMQGEQATLGLIEGNQNMVLNFIDKAHPTEYWHIHHVMVQAASSARLYPGLQLRLRQPCAIGELLAFAADLRRTSEKDTVWHADSKLLAQWIEPAFNQPLQNLPLVQNTTG